MSLDTTIVQSLYSFAASHELVRFLVVFCATYLIWFLVAWFGVVFIWHKKAGIKEFCLLVLGGTAGYLLNNLIAWFWFRPRPFVTLELIPIVNTLASKSFPSDHAMLAFFVATLLFKHNSKWWWAYLLASLVVLGRVVAGVHYLSDVVVGAILGVVLGMIVIKIEHKLKR
ncbi:MAG: phosphatase PAP2 family protein [Patescibacteria group bacterium]